MFSAKPRIIRPVSQPVRVAAGASAVALMMLATLASIAWAQDPPALPADPSNLSLEELLDAEVVYAASRYDQKASEAPAVVTIVGAEDIRRHGWRTLAEVLGAVRGAYTTSDRNYTYATFRGFGRLGDYNTHVLVMVDGHPLNENVGDSSYLEDAFPVELDLVERIEIIRGPSSSIYGTSAFFGVINVVTHAAKALPGTSINVTGSSFDGRSGNVIKAGLRRSVSWVASAAAREVAGADLYYPAYDDGTPGAGIARNSDDEESQRLFGRVDWNNFAVEAVHNKRQKGIPTGSFGTIFADPRSRTWDERDFVQLRHVSRWGKATTATSRLAYDRYHYDGHYVYDYGAPGAPDPQVYSDYWFGTWITGATQIVRGFDKGGSLLAGAELRRNIHQDQGAYDPLGTILDDRRSSTSWAAYGSYEQPVGSKLILNLGMRHDRRSSFGGTTSPRLAVIVTADEKTTMKLLYGRAFRAPNAYELYYQGGSNKAALSLAPEVIQTYDIVVDRVLWSGVVGTLSLYHYEVDDLINLEIDPFDGLLVYRNSGRASGRGVETELRGRLAGGLSWTASYAWQRARDKATDVLLPNSPQYLAKVLLSCPVLKDRVNLATDWSYISARATESGVPIDGALVGNLAMRWTLAQDKAELLLRIGNLADEAYADPGGPEHLQNEIPRDGRTWQLKVTVTP